MLFSRQKKLKRDREAGLVFCWRGGQGGNRGGLLFALLTASGIFALAFWVISLSFNIPKPESRKFAKILLLDGVSTEMALWVDQNTPFPSRWDPQSDIVHQKRVSDSLNGVFQQITEPRSAWREMPKLEGSVFTPKLVKRGGVQLGTLPKVEDISKGRGVFELIVNLDVDGALGKRLPEQVSGIEMKVPMQEYGSSLRLILTVDEEGRVIYCLPVEWQASDYAKNIENWVRTQRFKPAKNLGLVVGEATVSVEVKNHVGN